MSEMHRRGIIAKVLLFLFRIASIGHSILHNLRPELVIISSIPINVQSIVKVNPQIYMHAYSMDIRFII